MADIRPYWTVISRAEPKPEAETQFSDWEIWNGNGEPPTGLVQIHRANQSRLEAQTNYTCTSKSFTWVNAISPGAKIIAFRRVIEPVREEIVMTGHLKHFNAGGQMLNDIHRITFPTIDGKIATGEYTGPGGSVIKIEDLS